MTISAPAKINWNLRILGLREDGYHELETLMVPVPTLHDTLEIELSKGETGVTFTCDDTSVPVGASNLVVRAAKMFFEARGGECGVRIHLTKRIPVQAGLGGGSSDAAATLLGLNRLCGDAFSLETLEMLAGRLGADAAWFVRGDVAVCRGRGEIIGEAVALPRFPILLVKPPFGVSTPWAYRAWDELKGGRELSAPSRIAGAKSSRPPLIFNDLETPVFAKYTLLPVMKNWLSRQNGVLAAAMSGSGSTLFAILREARDAQLLAAQLRAKFGATLWVHY